MADEELRAKIVLDAQSFSVGVGEIVAKLATLEKGLESVGDKLTNNLDKSLGKANKSLESLSLKEASDKLEQLGQKASAAFSSIVTPAVQFETAMNSVNTVAKLGDKDLAALSEQMRTLGKDIGISIKPTEAAAAQYDILSAGFEKTADATEILTQASIASRGGLTSVASAADVITSALKAYGLEADQAKRVNDTLFIGVEKGKLRFEDFAQGLGAVVPAAAANGVSLQELSASMAALTVAGQQPARAFTGLNAAIVQLGAPTDTAKKAARQLGISMESAAFQSLSLVEKLQLLARTAGEDVAKKGLVRQVLGDVNALGVAYSLAGNGAKTYSDALAATQGPSNAAANAARINEKGVEAAQRRFEAASEAFKIGATKAILPAMEALVDFGTSVVDAFDAMPASLKEGITIVAGIAGAVGTLGAAVGGLLLGLKGLTLALGTQVPAAATRTTVALGETAIAAGTASTGVSRFLAVAGRIGVIGLVGTALVGLATYYVEAGKAAQQAADDAVNAAGKMSRAASVSTGAITSTPVDQLQAQGVGAEDVRNRIRPLRDAARNTAEKLTEVDKALEEQKRIGPGATKRIAELQAEKDSLIEASKKFEARIAELVAIEQKIGERARDVTEKATDTGIGGGARAGLSGSPSSVEEKDLKKKALFEIETSKLVGEERIKALQAYIAQYGLVGDEARHIEREIFQERKKLQEASETARKKAVEDEKADALQAIDISKAGHAQKIQQFRQLLTKYKDDADFRRNILRQIAQEEAAADKDREDRQQKAKEAAKKAQEEAKEKSSEERTARGDAITLRQDAITQQLGKEEAKGTKQSLSAIQVLLAEKQRLTEESIRLQLAEQLANTKSAEAKVQLERNAEERIRQEQLKTVEEFKRLKDEQVAKSKAAEEAMKPKTGPSTEFTGATLTPEQLAEQMANRFGGGAGNDDFEARRAATQAAQQKARDANIAALGAKGTPISAAVAALNAEKEKKRTEALVAIEAARRSGAGKTGLLGPGSTAFVPVQSTIAKVAASVPTTVSKLKGLPDQGAPAIKLDHTININVTYPDGQTQTQRVSIPGVPGPAQGGHGSVSFSPRGRA